MKRILTIILTAFLFNSAYASRCGLAVTFVNEREVEIAIKASIDWAEMEIDLDKENDFPGDVVHPIRLEPNSELPELFAFPCGYPGDPKEFWVNYGINGSEMVKRIKYKKGMKVVISKST